MKVKLFLLIFVLISANCFSIKSQNKVTITPPEKEPLHLKSMPEWAENAVLYEVNVRQYTPEGTLNAFREHLPRLKELGVDILWFMPIYPISETKRKGTLGSYYAISDFKDINPNFGTQKDFKALVDQAHEMGFKIMLDWVPNHTGWDHYWIKDHPEWYTKNEKGEIIDPSNAEGESWGWTDVADLNYDEKNLHLEMLRDMLFWVEKFDVDGFRCDVAGEVPTEFWNMIRREVDPVKELFWLAEAEKPELHKEAFDMAYAWEFHHLLNKIAKGEEGEKGLSDYLVKEAEKFSNENAILLRFITNHDENSWNGTVEERMGDAAKALAVLTYTLPGMPLIYSGQEVGLNHRLEFFEKDEIKWDQKNHFDNFYQQLNRLKHSQEALKAGKNEGAYTEIKTNNESVFAFMRETEDNFVLTVVNLSDKAQAFTLETEKYAKGFRNGLTMDKMMVTIDRMNLEPWGYQVLVK